MGTYCSISTEFEFGMMKNFLEMDSSDGCRHHECTYCHWIIHLKVVKMNQHNICPSVSGLFHLASCFQGSSMLYHVSEFYPFLELKIFSHNIQCGYAGTTFC